MTDAPFLIFTLEVASLREALKDLKPAARSAAKSTALPVLHCVRVDADPESGQVTFTATDLDLTIIRTVVGKVETGGSCLIPFADLDKLATVKKSGTANLSASADQVSVSIGSTTRELRAEPIAEYPLIDFTPEREIPFTLSAFAEILPFSSSDWTWPILCSVAIDAGTYVATDSYRLAAVETGADTGDAVLVPRNVGTEIARQKCEPERVEIGKGRAGQSIRASWSSGLVIIGRLIDGEFPNWRRLAPDNPRESFTFDPAAMALAVETARKLVDAKGTPVRVSTSSDGITLTLTDQDHGSVTETVSGTGPDGLTVAFDPAYMVDVISGTTTGVLSGFDALKPWVIREACDTGARVRILMPVRWES